MGRLSFIAKTILTGTMTLLPVSVTHAAIGLPYIERLSEDTARYVWRMEGAEPGFQNLWNLSFTGANIISANILFETTVWVRFGGGSGTDAMYGYINCSANLAETTCDDDWLAFDMIGFNIRGSSISFIQKSFPNNAYYGVYPERGVGHLEVTIQSVPESMESGYSLALLRTTAVPELSSWAMMIAGFGLAGGAVRRRKAAIA